MAARGGGAVDPALDARLQLALGWTFVDHDLLDRALTHRSYCAEQGVEESNERLEFLGDSVLGLVVTRFAYEEYPQLPEGELAKLRASVVSAETLADIAQELGLGASLRLGKGEDASGGRAKPSILADAMEAVIAAVYLDGGLEPATQLVLALLEGRIREQATGPGGQDYKTRLQELAARRCDQLPRYQVRHEGPDHSKRFFAAVFLRNEEYGSGEGRSKKTAEQAAAQIAWERLQGEAIGAPPDRGDRIGVGDA
ncbi:MAG TPA: ribonuclease III [Acidimicrobiia bacterium]|nr:ribonuclease III [Acidimicrobiia bacterium]